MLVVSFGWTKWQGRLLVSESTANPVAAAAADDGGA
jgi:hypothetical protein